MSRDLTAEDIAEELLYQTGKLLASDDPAGIEACFTLPVYLETQLGNRLIESKKNLWQTHMSVRQYYKDNEISDVVRTVISAEFIDAETVGSTHVSRLMRDGDLFRAPYPVYSIIRQVEGEWKIASSAYAILDAPEHNMALNMISQQEANDESSNP